jgi:hypothetical protein
MRPHEYLRRKKLDVHTFLQKDRYVMNRLNSHRRPVEPRENNIPIDSPSKRGLTTRYAETEQTN